MFFPWVGLFEQLRLSDVFVHYDDVQLPVGRSFTNRVQVKMAEGSSWLTAPLRRSHDKERICDAQLDAGNWRTKHLTLLRHALAKAPHRDDALAIAESVYALETTRIAELNIAAFERIAAYFGIERPFLRASAWGLTSRSSERLLEIIQMQGCDTYVTGHGARNYLDFELFERSGVRVRFMDYQRRPYPQLHGAFDPHVTILDLIANCGRAGIDFICSGTVSWQEFMKGTP